MRLISALCRVFSHPWRHNYKWMPTKRRCKLCGKEQKWNKHSWINE